VIKKSIVTSAYRGRSQNLTFSYVFRIWANIKELYGLIEEIYKLASEIRVSVNTSTYVVLKQLSALSLEKAVLSPSLTAEETAYRNKHITPRLSNECSDKLRALPKNSQSEYIELCRITQDAMSEIEEIEWLRKRYVEIEKKLLEGLLLPDFDLLKEVHVFFHDKVETNILKEFIEKEISDDQYDQLKSKLKIQSQKSKRQLYYHERINLAVEYLKVLGGDPSKIKATKNLHKTTVIRNAMTHGNYESVLLDEYADVLLLYCEFIRHWSV
ncbi:MAG TPA: hypothetical protein VJT50_17230, partial [Pyrinomonadaceae bacterium]|nr:hypothetical protein [Pyrinomonadaceae bacterium]